MFHALLTTITVVDISMPLPQAPVTSEVQYIFNVAMRDSNNITFAYRASNMSFFLTTYQQCVSDPDCQSQLHNDTTIITVCFVVGAVLVMLVGSTKALRSDIRCTMEKATLTNPRGSKFAVRGFRSPMRQLSAKKVDDKYAYKKSAPNKATPSSFPSKAQQGRHVHVDYDGDSHDDNTNASFGNSDEGRWGDTAAETRSLKASTRLMKSPPSGQASTNQNNDNNSSPGGQQATNRADRRRNKTPAPAVNDEEEDSISDETPHEQVRGGGGGGGGRGGDGDGGGENDDQAMHSGRRRTPNSRGGQSMMTNTKQDAGGSRLGGTRSRSRGPSPSRRPASPEEDNDAGSNGEEENAASSPQFSPGRSRGRGNRGL